MGALLVGAHSGVMAATITPVTPPTTPVTPPTTPVTPPAMSSTPPAKTPGKPGKPGAATLPSPKSLTISVRPARDRRKPYRFTIRGRLNLPAGVTTAKGCVGIVKVTGRRVPKTLFTKSVSLKKDCSYSVRARIKRKGKLRFRARFSGNRVLTAKRSTARSARAG